MHNHSLSSRTGLPADRPGPLRRLLQRSAPVVLALGMVGTTHAAFSSSPDIRLATLPTQTLAPPSAPEPASGWLLLAGVPLLGVLRRHGSRT